MTLKLVQGLTNLDAGESLFFQQELEQLLAQTFDVEYPRLKARQFIPVNNAIDDGAEVVSYLQFDKTGMAKLVSDYADDLPDADAFGQKFTAPIESIGNSFSYSIMEVRNAAMARRSLTMMKAESARFANEQKVDLIASFGDAATGLQGFVNNAAVPILAAPTGTWATATADQILDDMNAAVNQIITTTNDVEAPNTMILPIAQFTRIQSLRIPDTQATVLEFFLRTNPYIRNVDSWYRLGGAGGGATDRAIIYDRDSTKLDLRIPTEFEVLPVQEVNLSFKVPCHSRIGGVVFYKPLSCLYMDGI